MRMTYKTLIFIDSLNHFAGSPLAKLPKTFGLDVHIRKGYFPYLQPFGDYVGELPPASFFCYEGWADAKQHEFLAWYDDRKKNEWHHRNEQELYCKNDVWILSEAMRVKRAAGGRCVVD